eukprot:CAMPEP_0119103950 /NCGR_PEP_ID=MMETSP1180-20130426/2288_1 /TAXON_ID=3052 ORGANISM="Chlamydomonas cf sp, Strain CCMP681" /NCGR_SAMPLE_ID=MMETSP1180 /ASSEMBLY_ACC=CAM_ASM_000741 /LENGTH=147 /DNA_ID=CAMNT_0007088579 /DNA_START=45 /DNA_END=488 /DNA_ORIENTATION=+
MTGDGFLYHMVRVMAATLLEVGAGRLSTVQVAKALLDEDRSALPDAGPPCGLYLLSVWYNTDDMLAKCAHQQGRQALQTMFLGAATQPGVLETGEAGEAGRWQVANGDEDGDGPPVTTRPALPNKNKPSDEAPDTCSPTSVDELALA